MIRLVLALVLSLVAGAACAQSDPRTNSGGSPALQPFPRAGGAGQTDRIVGHVRVGERAPDFGLTAAGGARFRLKQTRGQWTALFFTDRRGDLTGIAELARTLDSLKFKTVVVCNEKAQSLAAWSKPDSTWLTPLGDERGEISSIYGLWDPERGATRPGLFLIDPSGVVKLAVLGQKVAHPSLRGLVQTAVDGL